MNEQLHESKKGIKSIVKRELAMDPRVVTALVVCANLVALGRSTLTGIAATAVVSGVYICAGCRKSFAVAWWVFMLGFCTTAFMLPVLYPGFVQASFGLIAFWAMRLGTMIGLGVFFVSALRAHYVSAALTRSHAPYWIFVPTLVIIRFFPAARVELKAIKEAMVLRGLSPGFWGMLRHPLQTGEYLVIPFLASAARIGDELTASSMIKGLGAQKKRSCIVRLRLSRWDWFSLAACVFMLISKFIPWPW